MKKIGGYLFAILLTFSCIKPMIAKAASLSVYANTGSAEVGDEVTFTVSASNGAGYVEISGAVNQSGIWLDNSSQSFTVTASQAGTLSVNVSGVIADYDTEEDQNLSDSASVTVVDNSPSVDPTPSTPNTPSTPSEPEEPEKSDDSRLYWLEVDKGTLSPEFSSYTYEYTVELTSKDKEITISADVWDNNASLSGTGLKTLEVGSNSFTVTVTAEDGSKTAYTVNVNVKEVATIFFETGDKKLGILNDVNTADIPKGFTEKTIQINNENVKAFENKESTLTLLYMTDESDNKGFYIYSEKDNEILGLYRPLIIDGKEYYVVDIPENLKTIEAMALQTIDLDDETLDCWSFEAETNEELKDYVILYLMNTDGKVGYYAYNTETKQLKEYPEDSPLTAKDLGEWLVEKKETPWLLYVGIGAVVVIAVAGGGVFFFLKNKKKKTASLAQKKESVDSQKKSSKKKSVKEGNKSKSSDRKLVTDDTFFKEVPEEEPDGRILDDDGIPLSIESALKDINESVLEETIIAKPKKVSEPEISADDNEDDDWLDEKMIDSVISDDTDLDLHFEDLFKDKDE